MLNKGKFKSTWWYYFSSLSIEFYLMMDKHRMGEV